MKKTIIASVTVLTAFGISACTTSTKVNVQEPTDAALSCAQLEGEFAKLDAVKLDAEGDKGVNTANVAAVLLFWPAAVGNYMDADKAEELVEKRRTHLMGIYTSKGCAG